MCYSDTRPQSLYSFCRLAIGPNCSRSLSITKALQYFVNFCRPSMQFSANCCQWPLTLSAILSRFLQFLSDQFSIFLTTQFSSYFIRISSEMERKENVIAPRYRQYCSCFATEKTKNGIKAKKRSSSKCNAF